MTTDKIVEIVGKALYGDSWASAAPEEKYPVKRAIGQAYLALHAAGYEVVPVEPSEAMLAHGILAAFNTGLDGEDGIGPSDMEAIYRAMITAAKDTET